MPRPWLAEGPVDGNSVPLLFLPLPFFRTVNCKPTWRAGRSPCRRLAPIHSPQVPHSGGSRSRAGRLRPSNLDWPPRLRDFFSCSPVSVSALGKLFALQLDDIDWRAGENPGSMVRGCCNDRMPLPVMSEKRSPFTCAQIVLHAKRDGCSFA